MFPFSFLVLLIFMVQNGATQIAGGKLDTCQGCPEIVRSYINNRYNIFQNGSYAVQINDRPKWEFDCYAEYPIEWIFHFEEEDDPDYQAISVELIRRFQQFDDPQTYTYHISVNIQYLERLRYVTNYTCQGVNNNRKRTRLVTVPNTRDVSLKAVTSENDYVPKISKPRNCTSLLFISLRTEGGPGQEPGPCAYCFQRVHFDELEDKGILTKYRVCDHLFLCRSIFPYVQERRDCIRYYKPNESLAYPGGYHLLPGIQIQHDAPCNTEPTFNAYVTTCRAIQGEMDVALMGFYGVGVAEHKFGDNRPLAYFRWNDVNTSDMIRIQLSLPPNNLPSYYEGQQVKVTCVISSFYCSLIGAFGYKWSDEASVKYSTTFEESHNLALSKVEPGLYRQTFPFLLESFGDLTLSCHGPVVNSSEWINATKVINVRQVTQPSIHSLNWTWESDSTYSIDYHDIGEAGGRLTCRFKGDPIKDVTWKYNGDDSLQVGITVEGAIEGGYSTLVFPELYKQLEGNYSCIVRTFGSMDVADFVLKIQGEAEGDFKNVAAILGILFALVATALLVGLYRMRKMVLEQRESLRSLTVAEIDGFRTGMEMVSMDSPSDAIPYDPKFEIDENDVIIDFQKMLGFGEFGYVYKGQLWKETGSIPLAIKTAKEDVDVNQFKALLSEVKILIYIGEHENIVGLIGASTQNIRNRKLYILVELCDGGSLEQHLRRNRETFINLVRYGQLRPERLNALQDDEYFKDRVMHTGKLFKWILETARGLSYIHSKKVVHGDLAVRNILLTKLLVVKISDFGLSRQLFDSTQYVRKTQGPLPWRYLAPESLEDRVFSAKSDVWGFGVTIWEIFTLGQTPYPGISFVKTFIRELKDGLRLEKPLNATNDAFEFMLSSWERNADDRPTPEDVIEICQNALRVISTTPDGV